MNLRRCTWVHFWSAIYCWAWSLQLRVVCIPSETLLETTEFSSPRDFSTGDTFWVRDGLCVHFSSALVPQLVQLPADLWAHWLSVITLIQRALFTWCPPCPLALILFLPFFPMGFPEPWRPRFDIDFPFMTESSKDSCALHNVLQLMIVFAPLNCSTFSKDGWARHWSISIEECR